MPGHVIEPPGDAHATGRVAFSCFSPCTSSSGSLVKKDQPEVCLSVPLQGGVCFFRPLLPAPSSAFLSVGFAAKAAAMRVYRVPRLRHDGLGSGYPPAVFMTVCSHMSRGTANRMPFGSGFSAPLACSDLRGVLSPIHLLNPAIKPSPAPPWCWQIEYRLAVPFGLSPGYIVSAASHPAITGNACADRLLLTAQQVCFTPPFRQSKTRLSRRTP